MGTAGSAHGLAPLASLPQLDSAVACGTLLAGIEQRAPTVTIHT
ncbi:hypothetical protein [Streptomyces sp. NPDC088707]